LYILSLLIIKYIVFHKLKINNFSFLSFSAISAINYFFIASKSSPWYVISETSEGTVSFTPSYLFLCLTFFDRAGSIAFSTMDPDFLATLTLLPSSVKPNDT
jgi:hypothetical protein